MLPRLLATKAEYAYTLLRTLSGLMFAVHGAQKLFGWHETPQPPAGSQIWIGAIIELVSGLAIAVGAGTPWLAFLASGTMAVAYVQFHWRFDLGAGLLPHVNKGELALLYALVFLFVACRGGGAWSVDGRRSAASARAG